MNTLTFLTNGWLTINVLAPCTDSFAGGKMLIDNRIFIDYLLVWTSALWSCPPRALCWHHVQGVYCLLDKIDQVWKSESQPLSLGVASPESKYFGCQPPYPPWRKSWLCITISGLEISNNCWQLCQIIIHNQNLLKYIGIPCLYNKYNYKIVCTSNSMLLSAVISWGLWKIYKCTFSCMRKPCYYQ